MPAEQNYYEILGISRDADIPAIKKRYRELVRRHHPDVRQDKASAEKKFVEITEAYKTLIDPIKRGAYDGTLIDKTQPVRPASRTRSTEYPRQGPSLRRQPVSPRVARIVNEAELAFIRRRLAQAASLCVQAIGIDNTCARAHAILGDIYRAKRKYYQAINEYTYAVQFDPADRASREKMEKLVERTSPIRFSWEDPDGKIPPGILALYTMGWGMVFFLIFLIYIFPGRPIPLLQEMNVPLVRNWSWHLLGLLFGDGALAGFLLGASGMVKHPDEELVFESAAQGRAIVPTGFLLLVFGPMWFLGVAIIYTVLAFMQDAMSRSIMTVFVVVFAIVLLAGLLYTPDPMSVIILGGNVVFVGALAGWYLGALIGPER